jgi:hypothetical protein
MGIEGKRKRSKDVKMQRGKDNRRTIGERRLGHPPSGNGGGASPSPTSGAFRLKIRRGVFDDRIR